MSEEYFYVPIIKCKINDLIALNKVSHRSRLITKPLIEITPTDTNKGVDKNLTQFLTRLKKYAPLGNIFVDFYGFNPGEKTSHGDNAVTFGFDAIKGQGRVVTPCYGFSRDGAIWSELRPIVSSFGQGFCFRIDADDLDDQAEDTWVEIIERTQELDLESSSVDLMIDLRDMSSVDLEDSVNLVIDFISMKPSSSVYRSIIIVGSSVLKTVSTIEKDGQGYVERQELKCWSKLRYELAGNFNLIFGDYGIVHPEFSDNNNIPVNMQAKIRYTAGDKINYFRGHNLINPPDPKQYYDLAAKVKNSPEYQGPNFSYGDRFIDECSKKNIQSPGVLGKWVLSDMNHHIEYTAQQIPKLIKIIDEAQSESAIARSLAIV